MGVYIKGMQMPKRCIFCSWLQKDLPSGIIYCTATYPRIDISSVTIDRRHDDCPLAEVPAPHGRLIDANALEQEAQKRLLLCEKHDNQFQKPYEILRAINEAPTIIEAEEDD